MSNSQAVKTITLRQLEKHLERNGFYKKSVILLGDSGLGKTQKIRDYAAKYAPDAKTPLLTLVASQRSTTDIQGMFVPTLERFEKAGQDVLIQKQTVPEYWLDMLFNPECKMVLFLDEITNTPPSMQNILYTLLQDREICGRKLADGVVIIAAGNHMNNGGFTNNLAKPLLNRCAMFNLASNTEEATACWLEDFAYKNNVHAAVCSWVEEHPDLLNTNTKDKLPNQPFFSQRCYGDAGGISDCLYDYESKRFLETEDDLFVAISSLCGEANAANFMKHYRYGEALPKAHHLLDGKFEMIHVSNETLSSIPMMQYVLNNVLSVWMSRFANQEHNVESLAKQLDNAFGYISENATKDLDDNLIATAQKLNRLVMDNQDRYNRSGAIHKFRNGCEVFKTVTRTVHEINKALKAA